MKRKKYINIFLCTNIFAFAFAIGAFDRFFDTPFISLLFSLSAGLLFGSFLGIVVAMANHLQPQKGQDVKKKNCRLKKNVTFILFMGNLFVCLLLLTMFSSFFDNTSALLVCIGLSIILGSFFWVGLDATMYLRSKKEQDTDEVLSGEEPTDEKQVVEKTVLVDDIQDCRQSDLHHTDPV